MGGGQTGKARPHIPLRRAARGRAFLVKTTVPMVLVPGLAWAGGSARDYLNAPINTWLTFSNSGYWMSVTPEDGLDVTSPIRTNVFSQAVIVTRTIDLWGRTGGISA